MNSILRNVKLCRNLNPWLVGHSQLISSWFCHFYSSRRFAKVAAQDGKLSQLRALNLYVPKAAGESGNTLR